jgi:hypothetical protein
MPRSSAFIRTILKVFLMLSAVAALTLLTQVGGIIYLLAWFSNGWIKRRMEAGWKLRLAKLGYWIGLYLMATFLIVPLLARPFGRVPLPVWGDHHLQPLRFFTCLLNRHYVRPELRDAAFEVADGMVDRYPSTTLRYLDANFPFFDGFPLFPHLSHGDGKKLDLAFCYTDPSTGEPRNGSPSWLGYGIYASPEPGEMDKPGVCAAAGHWQYSAISWVVPRWREDGYALDATRTKAMIELFAAHPSIGKIFIEPHLKARLGLGSAKVRYHGCQAVRHDEHVHVQLE